VPPLVIFTKYCPLATEQLAVPELMLHVQPVVPLVKAPLLIKLVTVVCAAGVVALALIALETPCALNASSQK
jgi:hypothetical protein